MRLRFKFAAAEFQGLTNWLLDGITSSNSDQPRETRSQRVRVVTAAADGWQRRSRAGFSWRLPSARVGSENGVGGDGREEATKKAKKSTTTMRFELTRAEHISLAGIGGIKNPNARARKTLNFV